MDGFKYCIIILKWYLNDYNIRIKRFFGIINLFMRCISMFGFLKLRLYIFSSERKIFFNFKFFDRIFIKDDNEEYGD